MSITIHDDIKNAIKRNDLVFFVGVAFSSSLGFQNWTDLTINILNQLCEAQYTSLVLPLNQVWR